MWCPMAALWIFVYPLLHGQDAVVGWNGKELRLAAPRFEFLTGRALERLKNGAAVSFDFQLTASAGAGGPPLRRAFERFVVSYDLWEEKFSVTGIERTRGNRRSGSHLTAQAAHSWCLENVALPTAGLAEDRPLYLQLDVQAAGPKEAPTLTADPAANLTALIDLFSRPARARAERHTLRAGPVRLMDLKR